MREGRQHSMSKLRETGKYIKLPIQCQMQEAEAEKEKIASRVRRLHSVIPFLCFSHCASGSQSIVQGPPGVPEILAGGPRS